MRTVTSRFSGPAEHSAHSEGAITTTENGSSRTLSTRRSSASPTGLAPIFGVLSNDCLSNLSRQNSDHSRRSVPLSVGVTAVSTNLSR